MAIYKIFAEADASIYSKFPSKNTGLDEILEVSVKNNQDSTNSTPYASPISFDDIRRSLIKFSDADLATIRSLPGTASYDTVLKLYIARAENLSQQYYLEFRQVAQSWTMGTGHVEDYPETRTGVSWYQTGSFIGGFTPPIVNWNLTNPSGSSFYFISGGGSWNAVPPVTQSFTYQSSKDVEVSILPIVNNWFSGSGNYGVIVKHPREIENNSGSFIMLNFFSTDTHTIFPPTLEMRWDDSVYNTGSLQVIYDSDSVITLANNTGYYNWSGQKYKFRINARDKYPTRVFTTSSLYTTNKALPQNSYWSLLDAKTNEVVFDYDYNYTKISCDATSSYFTMYMNGLEPERYYKLLVQSQLPDGEVIDWDSNMIFKVTK